MESGSKRFDRDRTPDLRYLRSCSRVGISADIAVYEVEMIAEISAIVAGVNMASNAIKQVAGTADDLSTIGTFLGKLAGLQRSS